MFRFEAVSDKFVFQDVILFEYEPVFMVKGGDDFVVVEDINDLNNFVVVDNIYFKHFVRFLQDNVNIFQFNKRLDLKNFDG